MPCNPPKTNADKMWPYDEYYHGERDEERRKNGFGNVYWSSPEFQDSYSGSMLRDTMHGEGEYRWRYAGPEHLATTYEGRFYNNRMHGYGMMSYPDGRVFTGLWHKNIRWGPGVETHARLREDVGLWHGYQLLRLAWRPHVPSVAIDIMSNPVGCNVVAQHRILMATTNKTIGEVNSALEILKQYGSDPLTAAEKWTKLYPKNCTDTYSQLCHVAVFDRAYFNNEISLLNEVTTIPQELNASISSKESATETTASTYFAWNNNKVTIHMMKHCFTHEEQWNKSRLSMKNILSGPRYNFKPPGKQELDSRSLLMASYLGHISNVAQLVNEYDIMPDVTDNQGNSAIMYAACGDQPEIIHFLVEAGADVDSFNDACCTPLGITILRYALEKRNIPYNAMLQAILPPPASGPPPPDEKILEWNIVRDPQHTAERGDIHKTPSKLYAKPAPAHKHSLSAQQPLAKKKSEKIDVDTLADTSDDKRMYDSLNLEYMIRVAEAYSVACEVNPVPYIFEVNNMCKDIEAFYGDESKKVADKLMKKSQSKNIKQSMKPSRDMMFQDQEDSLVDAKEILKQEKLSRIMATITLLLTDGADPRNIRCPQPPLFIAAVASSPDLVRELVKHGADVNEVYPQVYEYSALDIAVSAPLSSENLSVIRALLECGANPDHRLKIPETASHSPTTTTKPPEAINNGPTLLHAVLSKKIDNEDVHLFEIRDQMFDLLLKYGCNPITQYNGGSAVDLAMNKCLDQFDIFVKSPQTDLNAIINDLNQTILVKMFYLPFCRGIPLTERLQTLTNLLLYGADPLLKCQNGEDEYGNLFAFARKMLIGVEASRKPSNIAGVKKSKSDARTKKDAASKHGLVKTSDENQGDYKQALELVVDCARLLYIRWLQAKLMKELIDIVDKYRHRSWNMILKEHKNKKCTGLWLTVVRSLEIWDVLKSSRKRLYNDEKILKQVLCIIHFYYKRTRKIINIPLTFQDKEIIDREVVTLIHEHKLATIWTPDMVPPIRPYVAPELTVKGIEKFNVCFECVIPLENSKIKCVSCKLIDFCSLDCIARNIERINCHPCSSFLKHKYFPTPEPTESDTTEVIENKI
ncbi:ankyrin repeat and MYND domain-containing protein 1 isoform X1 [Spodoptera frugiperda]|uniref:Ankyrin repeat and MYND domain-containing protein 1 isoform X1 n=2 Tax=Spodoptera frugiperda TaxID=7108 RepID=A0A9R0EZ84_SPOFR|nr:ankyrin repeat and MYND domain-containing protein 1 isoform X1 [Spodoptera frugiperda]